MSWLYCHHQAGLGIRHLIVKATVTKSIREEQICVKSKRRMFYNKGHFYSWGQIFVINLETGREYFFDYGGRGSRDDAQPWVFDPMLRAIKVAELKEKERLTKLNKVVKLTKQKTGKSIK